MMPATIIAVEGGDHTGKFTQTNLLYDYLVERDYKTKLVEVPIKSALTYKLIYAMLNSGWAIMCPNFFQTIQFLNKWLFQFKLLFLRWSYDYIIFDRWALSSIVYGEAAGANPMYCRFLYSFLREPDATIILAGASRGNDEKADAYERDQVLQRNVRERYAVWYIANHHKCGLVDNIGTPQDVHIRILGMLRSRFDVII